MPASIQSVAPAPQLIVDANYYTTVTYVVNDPRAGLDGTLYALDLARLPLMRQPDEIKPKLIN